MTKEQRRERIRRVYRPGMTYEHAASLVGVSTSTISRDIDAMRDEGIMVGVAGAEEEVRVCDICGHDFRGDGPRCAECAEEINSQLERMGGGEIKITASPPIPRPAPRPPPSPRLPAPPPIPTRDGNLERLLTNKLRPLVSESHAAYVGVLVEVAERARELDYDDLTTSEFKRRVVTLARSVGAQGRRDALLDIGALAVRMAARIPERMEDTRSPRTPQARRDRREKANI